MKPQLKRIEAALEEASSLYLPRPEVLEETRAWHSLAPSENSNAKHALRLNGVCDHDISDSHFGTPVTISKPNPALEQQPKLPEFAELSDNPLRFVTLTNTALALNLLKDLQAQVGQWIASLENLLLEIQALYNEGPIVDGWLESLNPNDPSRTSYRLGGLDDSGAVWYQDCPHDQVADIGLAIVRYQRLQGLLAQKQLIESKLGCLTELLVEVHGKVAEVAR